MLQNSRIWKRSRWGGGAGGALCPGANCKLRSAACPLNTSMHPYLMHMCSIHFVISMLALPSHGGWHVHGDALPGRASPPMGPGFPPLPRPLQADLPPEGAAIVQAALRSNEYKDQDRAEVIKHVVRSYEVLRQHKAKLPPRWVPRMSWAHCGTFAGTHAAHIHGHSEELHVPATGGPSPSCSCRV